MRLELDNDMITNLVQQHRWAATGVSDYPPRDPLVGQSRFFKRFKTFIQTVDHNEEQFAHVFAVEAEWGRGKSRLGHELIAQINESSKGWFVRDEKGQLQDQTLFDQAKRDEYLALYIRYSQVASDYQNSITGLLMACIKLYSHLPPKNLIIPFKAQLRVRPISV
ncbi:hypothetical protein LIS44_04065 [Acinetobacter haemolyticus]|nr:hypothetical protein LIS44_04065 [Acinetobacter haemolyticus]